MLVIIANHLPPAVRGLLKVWCIEPKPHVFVTDLDLKSEERISKFLLPYFTEKSGMIIINSNKKTLQGFIISQRSNADKKMIVRSGLQLIEEKEPIPIVEGSP